MNGIRFFKAWPKPGRQLRPLGDRKLDVTQLGRCLNVMIRQGPHQVLFPVVSDVAINPVLVDKRSIHFHRYGHHLSFIDKVADQTRSEGFRVGVTEIVRDEMADHADVHGVKGCHSSGRDRVGLRVDLFGQTLNGRPGR